MKNILYITNQFPAKSETFIYNEVEFLTAMEKSIKIHVLSFNRPDLRFKSIENINVISGRKFSSRSNLLISFVKWRYRFDFNEGWKNLYYFIFAQYLIKRYNINHIHTHWPRPSMIGYMLKKNLGIPWTMSVHAHEVKFENRYFDKISSSASKISFCNVGSMNDFRERFDIIENSDFLNYHGTDINRFAYAPVQSLQILSVGRLAPSKGFGRIISIADDKSTLKRGWSFHVIGEGNEDISKALEASDNISLYSWMSSDSLIEYYRSANIVLLLPDQSGHDGIPNVIFEAMSCGKIVISSMLNGIEEVIEDCVNGFVVDINDENWNLRVKELLERVSMMTPDEFNDIAQAARLTIKSKYSSDRCLARFYETILK